MLPRLEQFIRERLYITNVTPATVEWYKYSFGKYLPAESPTEDELKNIVLQMREKGLKATGCNCVIRAINAYLKWSGSSLKIPRLKEPQLVLPTFTTQQVAAASGREAKEQRGTAVASDCALPVGHRLPHHGGANFARPGD